MAARDPNDPYNFFFSIPFISAAYSKQGRPTPRTSEVNLPVNARTKRQIGFGAAQEQGREAAQLAHGRLIDFGQNVAGNLEFLGNGLNNGWRDFHHSFDGHMDNAHNALQAFGTGVGKLLGNVSPTAAGLWNGLKAQVDKDINTSKERLKGFGDHVSNQINHQKQQAGHVWQGVRDNVDRPLHQGLGSGSTRSPLSLDLSLEGRHTSTTGRPLTREDDEELPFDLN